MKTAIVLATLCLALSFALTLLDASAPSPPPSQPRLRLELRAVETTFPRDAAMPLKVWLVNEGRVPISLVEPGDGSEYGWRTPAIEWLIGRFDEPMTRRLLQPDCGNMNPLQIDELFVIGPGQRRRLRSWVGRPLFPEGGQWRVQLRYRNDPQRPWRDEEGQSEAALGPVRRTAAVDLLSNEIEVSVE